MLKKNEKKVKSEKKSNPTGENSWSFDVPFVHPSLNVWTRLHWTKRNALKAEIEWTVYVVARDAGVPLIEGPVELFITYYHPKESVDLDNYVPKFFIDGLKMLFKDDNFKILKKIGWTFVKDKEKRSTITISRV